jgi:glucosamine--fructose-6-phosphate aminotransferase (isomerizing)
MCGIFAYLNFATPKKREEIIEILLQGLRRMEYRGYDSAGIAIDSSNDSKHPFEEMAVLRKVGKVDALEAYVHERNDIDSNMVYNFHCGIAHTRWATHGSPSDVNSHPQRSAETNDFVVVHNGIITNYREIKEYLQKKHYTFESETDTEVIAKLIQHIHERYPNFSFRQLVETTIQQLEGAFALAFKSRLFPNQLVASRRGSPLLVGIKSASRLSTDHVTVKFSNARNVLSSYCGEESFCDSPTASEVFNMSMTSNGGASPARFDKNFLRDATRSIRPFDTSKNFEAEYFLASDASAIIEHTKQVLYLEDDDVAVVESGLLSIHRIKRHDDPASQTREVQQLNMELQQIMRGDYTTFMQKEIFEQPDSVVNTMRGRVLPDGRVVLGGIKEYLSDIKRCRRLILIACGTSYNSAIACRQTLEELSELPVILELASDFLDRETPIFRDDVCLFISQSGETADTLNALRYCKPRGALLIGVTNTVGSSICRESHCGIHINAGPEIGVASTKAYTSQIISIIMFALTLGDDRISLRERRCNIIGELMNVSDHIKTILKLDDEVKIIAKEVYQEKSLLVMGRGYNFATCLEGALKIKELSYMHCEGIMSGELKHGPLAMVDEKLCIVMVICTDHVYKKSLNALQQVLARKGRPIVIADENVPTKDLDGIKHILRVPKTVDCLQNILTVIPLQMLSYHIAELNGLNVDRPRNLAKSVTVE